MISIEVEGLEGLEGYIERLKAQVLEGTTVAEKLGEFMEQARVYAAEISPVVTGSYQAAHEVVLGENEAILQIDPLAHNIASGVPVTAYAPFVEEMHSVYSRTHAFVGALAESGVQIIGEVILHGN